MEASQPVHVPGPANFVEIVRLLLFLVKFHLAFIWEAGRARTPSRGLALCDRDQGYLGWLFYHLNAINRAGKLRYAHALIRVVSFWYKMAELTASVETWARKTREKGIGKQFRWDSEMAENFMTYLQNFKSQMEYNILENT